MRSTSFLLFFAAFLVQCSDAKLFGATETEEACTCPLCKTKFKAILDASGSSFGRRLDLKPIGAIVAPWRLPVCPKCKFVQFKDADKFKADELKALKKYVESDAYKSISPKESSYYRVARMFEHLKKPAIEIAHVYLKASWQAEGDERQHKACLDKSLEHFVRFLATNPGKNDDYRTANFLRGELLRQLGKFDAAKKHFLTLQQQEEFKTKPFPEIIAQELELIEKKNAAPQTISKP